MEMFLLILSFCFSDYCEDVGHPIYATYSKSECMLMEKSLRENANEGEQYFCSQEYLY